MCRSQLLKIIIPQLLRATSLDFQQVLCVATSLLRLSKNPEMEPLFDTLPTETITNLATRLCDTLTSYIRSQTTKPNDYPISSYPCPVTADALVAVAVLGQWSTSWLLRHRLRTHKSSSDDSISIPCSTATDEQLMHSVTASPHDLKALTERQPHNFLIQLENEAQVRLTDALVDLVAALVPWIERWFVLVDGSAATRILSVLHSISRSVDTLHQNEPVLLQRKRNLNSLLRHAMSDHLASKIHRPVVLVEALLWVTADEAYALTATELTSLQHSLNDLWKWMGSIPGQPKLPCWTALDLAQGLLSHLTSRPFLRERLPRTAAATCYLQDLNSKEVAPSGEHRSLAAAGQARLRSSSNAHSPRGGSQPCLQHASN